MLTCPHATGQTYAAGPDGSLSTISGRIAAAAGEIGKR